MSTPGASGAPGDPPAQGPPRTGPPYAPQVQSLGGVPDVLPDIPATAVFLALYIFLAVTHLRIFKGNKVRGHKFLFSGALFGFCQIRIVTMTLRIAWACHRTNIVLAIVAQIFVYVGTIILYLANWFFVQRIVRAQHPRWGWSMPYRVFHRASIAFVILSLFVLIEAAIQQFLTLDTTIHRVNRDMQLAAQTYFAAFCFAPIVVITISLLLPRKGTEKFGAGRLRNAIIILLVATVILSTGQIFRCATTWLTPVPLRNSTPWYLSKACFYVFNFTTESLIVIFYAVVRVDLRFHVPNGSKAAGDYSAGRNDRYHVGVIGNEKVPKPVPKAPTPAGDLNVSRDTLHEYEASLWEDTRTLADSLQYPSSVLEIDSRTGHWKIKRQSRTPSTHSARYSNASQPSLSSPDRDTYVEDIPPPVPPIPTDWPLRESNVPQGSVPAVGHRNNQLSPPSDRNNEVENHDYNGVDTSDAFSEVITRFEENSSTNILPRRNESSEYAQTKGIPSTPVNQGSALAMHATSVPALPEKTR